MNVPPGPRGRRSRLEFALRPGSYLDRTAERYGDLFSFEVPAYGGGTRVVVATSDPQIIEMVFKGDPEVFHAGEGNVILLPLLGPSSVLLLDEGEHMRQRRLLLPSFHGERLARFRELMEEIAERELAELPRGRAVATLPTMQAITLEVIMRVVFGSDDERLREAIRAVLDPLGNRWRMLGLLIGGQDSRPWRRLREDVAAMDEVIHAEIRRHRGGGEDVMSMLLDAGMEEKELRDELVTLLVAGHETTATALAWALERSVRHPDGLRDGDEEWLDAVTKETLRLRPVVPAVVRRLTQPVQVRDYELPPGVNLAPSIYLTHRRPDVYPEPLEFRPERFLGVKPGTYTWIPFGGGVRRCLGASFAQMEMAAVLSVVARSLELQPQRDGDEGVVRRAITFAPSKGGRVTLRA